MVVVEDEDQPFTACADLVQQVGQQRGDGRRCGRGQGGQGVAAGIRQNPLDGEENASPEAGGLIVVSVKRQPRSACLACLEPVAQQGRLAGAGRSGDQDQALAVLQAAVQARQQPGAHNPVGAWAGAMQLGGVDGHRAYALRDRGRDGAVRQLYKPGRAGANAGVDLSLPQRVPAWYKRVRFGAVIWVPGQPMLRV
jgi:hypothetical protein